MSTRRVIGLGLETVLPRRAGFGSSAVVAVGRRGRGQRDSCDEASRVLGDDGNAVDGFGAVGRGGVRRDVVAVEDEAGDKEGDAEGEGQGVEVHVALGLAFFRVRSEDLMEVIVVGFQGYLGDGGDFEGFLEL